MDEMQLIKNENGDVVTQPVTHWGIAPAADMNVLLAIAFVNSQEALEKEEYRQVQLLLTPQKCLELAEALTRQAKRLMESSERSPN